jgi:hypothetical protein
LVLLTQSETNLFATPFFMVFQFLKIHISKVLSKSEEISLVFNIPLSAPFHCILGQPEKNLGFSKYALKLLQNRILEVTPENRVF